MGTNPLRTTLAARCFAVALPALLTLGCPRHAEVGHQLFTSPQTNPILLSEDGRHLVVANTTSGTVSIYDVTRLAGGWDPKPGHALLAQVEVGLDPVGLAQRPGSTQVYVANYISDSISVVDLARLDVVDTIQELDANGVTRTDAPTGVVFASPTRAFVSLDDENQVLVLDTAPDGSDPAITARLPITAQAPRALAVMDGKLYVAAFESENGTEFPTCSGFDPRLPINGGSGLDESNPFDEGCEFATQIIQGIQINSFDPTDPNGIALSLDTIFDFAAMNPNVGGRIIRDHDRPDRDLFVFDAATLALEQVVEGVGTLLYGVEARAGRVWVTNTDARNHLEGLAALENRMFENRLSFVDCAPACGAASHVDLDQNGFGVPVPTPYGVRSSADGSTLVVSVAGSDGIPGLATDPDTDIPGLVTLDADGNVLGHLQTGAIPQGIALASGPGGAPGTAYVLNTVDSSVSVVDVSDPAHPDLLGTFPVGSDPTSPLVKRGRIMFSSARASTHGEFSCESCHPNANIDQVLWVINTVEGPNDVPGCNPFEDDCPEPRTTMPIRGLEATMPLHWVGNLADPFPDLPALPGQPGQLPQPEDAGAPDCNLATDGDAGCARHLVNASLSGVMCDQSGGCPTGPSGLAGALTDDERDGIATFLVSVSYPPSPKRAPTDALTPTALQGVQDFFTDEDDKGVAGGIGQVVGFAPLTCADNSGGCHALPLGHSTNSLTVGGFDAPGMRGIWDRFILFSNGNVSSEEWLRVAQDCADGNPPVGHTGIAFGPTPSNPNPTPIDPFVARQIITGDPCALKSTLAPNFSLDPFPGQPSGEHIYDPDEGMTERGQFLGTFEAIFHLAYGVRGAPMWEFFSEMSVGMPGLTGRQISLEGGGAPDVVAAMNLMQQYDAEGRISAMARNGRFGDYKFEDGRWRPLDGGLPLSGNGLRAKAAFLDATYTITAHLPPNVTIGGADRQILLDIDPDAKAEEMRAKLEDGANLLLAIPRPSAAGGDVIRIGAQFVEPGAVVIVDGDRCETCPWTPAVAATGEPAVDITLGLPLEPGPHVLQMLNPKGWMSNEMPLQVPDPDAPPEEPAGE